MSDKQTEIFWISTKIWMIVVVTLKNADGVQNAYLRGTIFFEVQNGQMGYCTPKWGTAGSPGVGVPSDLLVITNSI